MEPRKIFHLEKPQDLDDSWYLMTRAVVMVENLNPWDAAFGGWILGQMDLAANLVAWEAIGGPTATRALTDMEFLAPLYRSDVLSCYGKLIKTGKSSLTVDVVAWRNTRDRRFCGKSAHGTFTLVCLCSDLHSTQPLPQDLQGLQF